MAYGGSFDRLRDFASVSGALKKHHTHIQALFRSYLRARTVARPAIVEEIFDRLHSHLEMEETVLLEVVHNSGLSGIDLVEDTILEHEEIQAMFRQLQQSNTIDEQAWEEMFEDMIRTVRVHFITEERDLLPLIDRSHDV